MTTSDSFTSADGVNPPASAAESTSVNSQNDVSTVPHPRVNLDRANVNLVPEERLFDVALDMHNAGINVVPVKENGSKRPDLPSWTKYQKQRTTADQVWSWFGSDQATGLGCIYGEISGNTEMLEFEGRAVEEGILDEVTDLMENSGYASVWEAITTGWAGQSPSGGFHFRFRVTGMPVKGNTKLASREARDDELDADERELKQKKPDKLILRGLIETRGEGGFGVCEPSHGKVHPSGRPYIRVSGGPDTMPVIDAETYEAIHDICQAADQTPKQEAPQWRGRPMKELPEGQLRPGDDYNQRGDIPALIQQHGWTFIYQRGQTSYWCRPGKNKGVSASFNYRDCGKLYVFTSSTEFDNEKAYSPFAAYAILEHGGNYKEAAKGLGAQGYGTSLPEKLPKAARDLAAYGVWDTEKLDDNGQVITREQRTVPAPATTATDDDAPENVQLETFEDHVDAFGINSPSYKTALEIIYEHKPDQMGIAELFTVRMRGGEHLRWNEQAGRFYGYADGHWIEDGAQHLAVAKKADMLGKRVTLLVDNDILDLRARIKMLRKGEVEPRGGLTREDEISILGELIKARPTWYKAYRSAGSRAGIIDFVKTAVDQVASDRLDADPHLLNFVNGTYDVRTGELRDAEPEDYLTHRVDRALDMTLAAKPLEEVAPRFHALITRACAAPGEVADDVANGRIEAVKRSLGAMVYGECADKAMMVYEGASDTGKTQLLEVVLGCLGSQLAASAQPKLLIKGRGDRHESVEYKLKGRRVVLVNELTQQMTLDEGQVLRLVNPGGTSFSVRQLHQQEQDIPLTWNISITTNELPRAKTTQQVLNRLRIFPMSQVSVPKEDQDAGLRRHILTHEAEAVLAHLVTWWSQWYAQAQATGTGLLVTDEMREALAGFEEDNSSLAAQFRDEMTVRTEEYASSQIRVNDIWSRYTGWHQVYHPNEELRYGMNRRQFYAEVLTWPGVRGVYKKNGTRPDGTPKQTLIAFEGMGVLMSPYGDVSAK